MPATFQEVFTHWSWLEKQTHIPHEGPASASNSVKRYKPCRQSKKKSALMVERLQYVVLHGKVFKRLLDQKVYLDQILLKKQCCYKTQLQLRRDLKACHRGLAKAKDFHGFKLCRRKLFSWGYRESELLHFKIMWLIAAGVFVMVPSRMIQTECWSDADRTLYSSHKDEKTLNPIRPFSVAGVQIWMWSSRKCPSFFFFFDSLCRFSWRNYISQTGSELWASSIF